MTHCKKHDYIFIDKDKTHKIPGYFDENGTFYESLVIKDINGMYRGVLCGCPYCGTQSELDYMEGQNLVCPACGGAVTIKSALDELVISEFSLNKEDSQVSAMAFRDIILVILKFSFVPIILGAFILAILFFLRRFSQF